MTDAKGPTFLGNQIAPGSYTATSLPRISAIAEEILRTAKEAADNSRLQVEEISGLKVIDGSPAAVDFAADEGAVAVNFSFDD